MKAVFLRAGAIALALSLAGCATMQGPAPVEVTRFHLGGPIARGEIAVEAFDPADANSLEFQTYAASVARQLARVGYTVVNTVGKSELVALIDVEQGSRAALARRSPVSIGIGGATGGWHSGVGLGATFGLGGGRARQMVGTMLEVRIKRRSDGTVFWEGRATTEAPADSPEAQRPAAVEKLAEALFRDFPGESGRTIRVK